MVSEPWIEFPVLYIRCLSGDLLPLLNCPHLYPPVESEWQIWINSDWIELNWVEWNRIESNRIESNRTERWWNWDVLIAEPVLGTNERECCTRVQTQVHNEEVWYLDTTKRSCKVTLRKPPDPKRADLDDQASSILTPRALRCIQLSKKPVW